MVLGPVRILPFSMTKKNDHLKNGFAIVFA